MSSILEALKKLEAEKNSPAYPEPTPADELAYPSDTLLGSVTEPTSPGRSIAPLFWVLGGGIFTLLVIGVAVLLVMMLLLNRNTNPTSNVTASPAPPPPPAAETAPLPAPTTGSAPMVSQPVELPPVQELVASEAHPVETAPPSAPVSQPAPKAVESIVEEPPAIEVAAAEVSVAPVKASPPPKPALEINLEPLPEDIRSLPMLNRHERSQYRLEGIQLNMLNEAGPTRPLGNAFINLEKVFVGEFLPGTNAKLVDVTSHGIAVEIQSTLQRYYIPR